MEHAVPEKLWVDRSQCRYVADNGSVRNPALPDCVQGISAVKAIAIAQLEGQRIYAINQANASTALAKLPIGGSVGQEVRSAVQSGKEVIVHERPVNIQGWSGYGYVITDPETGAGGYIIEGRGNGGWLLILFAIALIAIALFVTVSLFLAGYIAGFGLALALGGFYFTFTQLLDGIKSAQNDSDINRVAAFAATKALASIFLGWVGAAFYGAQIAVGALNSMMPFTMLNFSIFFFAGWFA